MGTPRSQVQWCLFPDRRSTTHRRQCIIVSASHGRLAQKHLHAGRTDRAGIHQSMECERRRQPKYHWQQRHDNWNPISGPSLSSYTKREIQRRSTERHPISTQSAIWQRRMASVLPASYRILCPNHIQWQRNGQSHAAVTGNLRKAVSLYFHPRWNLPAST